MCTYDHGSGDFKRSSDVSDNVYILNLKPLLHYRTFKSHKVLLMKLVNIEQASLKLSEQTGLLAVTTSTTVLYSTLLPPLAIIVNNEKGIMQHKQ